MKLNNIISINMSTNKIIEILGDQSDFLLNHTCKTIDKSLLHIPSPNTIDEIWMSSDRNTRTLNSLQSILSHGRLANSGYVSILPVDQGVEHSAGASFAPNPLYFDPENIISRAGVTPWHRHSEYSGPWLVNTLTKSRLS